MPPGDEDLIIAQFTAHNGKIILLLKPNVALIVLLTTSQKLAYQLVHYTVESHKQFALAHSSYLKYKKTQHSLQLTSPPAVSTSMHQQITKITYTALAAQHVLAKQAE
jgi:hypothetical protein